MTREDIENIIELICPNDADYERPIISPKYLKQELEQMALEQEPKTGHWIDHQEDRWIYAKCSECETVHDTRTNYCPNCGARMVEPQESEDKE